MANSFWKSVTVLSAGQIISLLISILTIPLLARIYTKAAFGEFAIIVSSAGIIVGFIGLGLGSAIMAPKSDEESEDILVSLFTLQIFITSIMLIVLLSISGIYQMFTLTIPYWAGLIFMFFYILLTNLSSLMTVYMNKLNKNRVLMLNPILGAVSLVIIKIPFGLLGLDSIGLLLSTIFSGILVNINLLRVKNPFFRRFSIKKTINIFKTYKKYVIYQYPANLLNQLAVQFPNQYIGRQFGNESLADLDMSNRVVQQPLNLVTSPIQTVFFRVASKKVQDGEDISTFTYSFVRNAMIVGILPLFLLSMFGEQIFGFVLGAQWGEAGKIAAIMSLSYLFFFTNGCITYARVVMDKQKSNLITTFINILITVGLMVGAGLVFQSLISMIYAYSIASVIFNVMNIFITLKILNKNQYRFLAISFVYIVVISLILFFKYFL